MISAMGTIRTLSDIIMVFSTIGLIAAFGISKCRGLKYRLIAAFAVLCTAAIVSLVKEFQLNFISSAVYPIMFIMAYYFVFGKIKMSHIYIAVMSESITSLFASCFCAVIESFTLSVYMDIKIVSLLFVRLIFMLTAIILDRSEKVRVLHKVIKNIPKHIFILTALSVVIISFLASNNSFSVENQLKQIINTILISALTVSLIIMIFSLLINVVAKKQFREVNDLLRSQVEIQLRHYKRLEKLNDDIRSFRHDYTNHMRSVISLLEMGQYEDAKEYVEKLVKTSPGQNFSYQTGNFLADAILTDKSDLCGEYAKIIFYGFIPDKIDNSDLCIILSNAVDNAAEACEVCGGDSLIEIFAQVRQGYFVLTIRNPTEDRRTYYTIPETTKPDASDHGFGLRNIESVVVRNGGRLKVKCENMVFELSLTLKL